MVTLPLPFLLKVVVALRHNHILTHVFMTTLGVLSHIGNHVGVLKIEKAARLSHEAVREERVPDRTEEHSEQVCEVREPSCAGISGDDGGMFEDTHV